MHAFLNKNVNRWQYKTHSSFHHQLVTKWLDC